MKYAPKTVPGDADVGVPHGNEDGPPELRPEGPDQKSTAATLISMKNWRGLILNSQAKGRIGPGVPDGSPFLLGFQRSLEVETSESSRTT